MVTAPQSTNATVDAIRGYFNAYLMHTLYVNHLVHDLGATGLYDKEWVHSSKVGSVHKNLKKLLTVLKYNVRNLAQLVSNVIEFLYLISLLMIIVE